MIAGRVVQSVVDNIALPVAAVVLSLVTVALLLLGADQSPIDAYSTMVSAAFGGWFELSSTVVKTLPRLLPALGIALALRAGLWNIGAEGQLYVGAVAAAGVGVFGPNLAAWAAIPLGLAAATGAGALWALIPGLLRAYRGVSEIITSLMLVYVGINLATWLVEGPWQAEAATFPFTEVVQDGYLLPTIWSGTLVDLGVVAAVIAVLIAWLLMDRSTYGIRLRALGGNQEAARFQGIAIPTTIVSAMLLSGAFAGVAGGVEVMGVRDRFTSAFSPGYGFEAIAIALLGRLSPGGIVAASLLFGALDTGGAGLQVSAVGVPASIVQITVGLAVVYMLAGAGILTRRRRRRAALATLSGADSQATLRTPGEQLAEAEPAR